MSMEDDLLVYQSIFKPDTKILVVFKENPAYPNLEPIFEQFGFGFYVPNDKTIIIDGDVFVDSDLDMDDLRFVEAHEISHLLLNHDGPRNEDDELDADLGAYILLKRKHIPIDRLIEVFPERHGIEFSEDLLGRVENFI